MKQLSMISQDECKQELCDVHKVARYFNVTPRYIQLLVKKGVLPRSQRGKYDLIICIHAYLDYLKKMLNYFVVNRPQHKQGFLQSFEPPYRNYHHNTPKGKLSHMSEKSIKRQVHFHEKDIEEVDEELDPEHGFLVINLIN